MNHSPHCRACKERVRELLTAIFGPCRLNHSLPWSAHPADYANSTIGDALARVHVALTAFRDHRDFIKSAMMPPCDYFMPDPVFILEFDESQHFSAARLVTLANYPGNIPLGFSIERWQELCREIDAKDDEPFDRDERRAWYDTLRDLLPIMHGFKPTVRLYAEEFEWCNLKAGSAGDVDRFRRLLRDRLPSGTR
jgi:hypothetical protein